MKHKIKIFIGLVEIAGYYSNLQKGFAEMSIKAVFVDLSANKYQYDTNNNINPLIAFAKYSSVKNATTPRSNILVKIYWKIIQSLACFLLFLWAITTFDIFIFGFNSSFLGFADLPILRLFKKRIIYMFNGSDSRPPYLSGGHSLNGDHDDVRVSECIEQTKSKKKIIDKIDKYANIIINYPPQSFFHTRDFISGLFIGIPVNSNKTSKTDVAEKNDDVVCILHCPSNPLFKGTDKIHKAVDSLIKKGRPIEYKEIIGRPNSEVLKALKECDFVVDELYSDTPLAGFGTEAAVFGKPTVVGGYYSDFLKKDIPQEIIPPSLFCHPDKMEDAIDKLVCDTDYRIELGKKAYRFVTEHWNARSVAEKYLMLINNEYPKQWLYDPNSITYFHGWGFQEQKAKELIRAIVKKGGVQALQLSDKQEVLSRILQFASSTNDQCCVNS
jgi:glycosyltransferase involved in cell wall biosynthesis